MRDPSTRPNHPDFPGAPEGSYVCDEGWLVIGDQAWTPAEWRARKGRRAPWGSLGLPSTRGGDRSAYDREYMRLWRARKRADAA